MKKEYVSPVLDEQLVQFRGCLMASNESEAGGGKGGASGTLTPMPGGAPKKA